MDEVIAWNGEEITCLTRTHYSPDNPLRDSNVLPAVCGIEYAAQTMAVHRGLQASAEYPPGIGYLGSVRDVKLYVQTLHNINAPLLIIARRLTADARALLYEFRILADERLLLDGRAAVVLEN